MSHHWANDPCAYVVLQDELQCAPDDVHGTAAVQSAGLASVVRTLALARFV